MVGIILWVLLSYTSTLTLAQQNATRDIAAVVESSGFSNLLRLLMQAGLKQVLMVNGPFTLFAPTDDAFEALDQTMYRDMLLDPAQRKTILLNHVLPGMITWNKMSDGESMQSAGGAPITFQVSRSGAKANDARILNFDIGASNGVIHVVDKVLLPPRALESQSKVNVLKIPQGNPLPNNIIDVTKLNGLNSVAKLLSDAGLAMTLSTKGPYTLFAPSEEAFSRLEGKLLENIQSDGDLLRSILLYHVLPGKSFSGDMTNDLLLPTVQGESLRVNIFKKPDNMVALVNGANFLDTDISTSNGLVHVIDKVLIPPGGNIMDVLGRDPQSSLFVDAVRESNMTKLLSTDSSFTVFAPNNKAFLKVDPKFLERAMKEKKLLKSFVMRHIVLGINHGPVFSKVLCWDSITSSKNVKLKTGVGVNGTLVIGSPFGAASIVKSDIMASNGVIHEIDAIL